MRTINILEAFTWRPEPPAPGKRLPPELREQSFKPNRVEHVHDDIADYAILKGFARDPADPKGKRLADLKRKQEADAKAKEKAATEAKTKAQAEQRAAEEKAAAEKKAADEKAAAEKKAAEEKAKGGAGKPDQNPSELKFELVKVDAKTFHVAAKVGEATELVNLTAAPLPKVAADSLLADLNELQPKTLDEAKQLAASEEG